MIKASVWLAKIGQFRPDISDACVRAFEGRQQDKDFLRPDRSVFAACPPDSIDYVVMESLIRDDANRGEVAVVPLSVRWSDVGAWSALWEMGDTRMATAMS